MDNIVIFLGGGLTALTALLIKSILSKNKNENMVGGNYRNEIDLSRLSPKIYLKEKQFGKKINATIEKNIFQPVFENPLNAKKESPTDGVHITVPGLMPASNDIWEDKSNTVYYMPNDQKPHFHGDAPHHMAMFDINEVFHMNENRYFKTVNKQIKNYRNEPGIIDFNNGKSNTPVEVWIHWRIPYDKKEYPKLIVKKNSIIWWDFTNHHNLVIVDSEENYKNNKFKKSKEISTGKELNTLVTFMNKTGTFYFACTRYGHAKNGHKIKIHVI